MSKKIAYFTNSKTLFTNNTVLAVFREFLEQDVEIHLICPDGNVKLPDDLSKIKKHKIPNPLILWPKNPLKIISAIADYVSLAKFLYREKVETLIGQDHVGLIIAGRLNKILKCKNLVYFSFEIYFQDELNTLWDKKLKEKELKYALQVTDILIQDKVRMSLLKTENNVSEQTNWHLIPVATTSDITHLTKNVKALKEKLSIPNHFKLAIHSGSVEAWSGAQFFIDALKGDWPSETWLVIHSFEEFSDNHKVHLELKELQQRGVNVTLYHHIFENDDQYFEFLKCFDVGFALYAAQPQNGLGKNIGEIGLASGKFSNLMMLGIPTIVTDSTFYPELFEKYLAGEVIKEYTQINPALKKIVNANQDKYAKEAKRLYDEVLNPKKAIHEMVTSLI
ncbi:glycosyltransferase [Pedobacter boryungensis]|uniref:Glycosyltransferase subfamily 4-like N-terminal domain-containing protein n=1 Tax=Pedobacter boryungensis TaxID=869962 RepID=A0ABX2D874_9SPHI|nr:glycosyltransferase [Pedobacter boryungensis]NQX30180.1 hypothetical protein [Pedobacter boryungensis]